MQLSKDNLGQIALRKNLEIPNPKLFELPEKVLQFGSGVLLRGLPDYFIDKANKQGIFNGRVVIVKTTASDSSSFDRQDSLFTACIRGLENGNIINENIINASISRVLSAKTDWKRILECAHNPEMKIVISNTTEVGIELIRDDINGEPPVSFPGKLLAFLYERYRAFNGSEASGMVIIPTELISENGSKLESIVLELAHWNNLEYKFIEWLETHNTFCNSLVDRIVPGMPIDSVQKELEMSLGYSDELLIISEVFRLWAIEGNEKVKEALAFSGADMGVVITSDITHFKELKLRLLNGAHSFNSGIAFLSGFNYTREAVSDKVFMGFMKKLIFTDISAAIPFEIDQKVKEDFAGKVLDRFGNPFIDHQWLSITVQQTAKMKLRNIPLLINHYTKHTEVPVFMAVCFAGFLLFMRSFKKTGDKYFGERNGVAYEIKDDYAAYFFDAWNNFNVAELPKVILSDTELWDNDLTKLPGFLDAVQEALSDMLQFGVFETIKKLDLNKVTA
jgi:tagaturonate reductase